MAKIKIRNKANGFQQDIEEADFNNFKLKNLFMKVNVAPAPTPEVKAANKS